MYVNTDICTYICIPYRCFKPPNAPPIRLHKSYMDEIDCKIILSNSHVFASKQVNILMTILKRCQLVKRCQIVKGCKIVTPKYAMLKFK